MKSGETFEFQVQLENRDGDGYTTVTVNLEVDENGRVNARGVGEKGGAGEYEVGFVVRSGQGGDHCWWCLNEPCPPNRLSWVTPCPTKP